MNNYLVGMCECCWAGGCCQGGGLGQTTPAAPSLAGVWKGPLPVPGGSLPIQIAIQHAGPAATAELTLPEKG